MESEAVNNLEAMRQVTQTRFERDGEAVYNLGERITGSPGAAWHVTVRAFRVVAERIPSDAPPGTDQQDLLLMACWESRRMIAELESNAEYAEQLRKHDEAHGGRIDLHGSVAFANLALPIDQREILALRRLSNLSHNDLAGLLRADPPRLAMMLAQSRLMLRDAMRGSEISRDALATTDSARALALASLRQDGQLRGAEARMTLARWLEGDESRRALVDALEEAGLAYKAWETSPVPDGLDEAVLDGLVEPDISESISVEYSDEFEISTEADLPSEEAVAGFECAGEFDEVSEDSNAVEAQPVDTSEVDEAEAALAMQQRAAALAHFEKSTEPEPEPEPEPKPEVPRKPTPAPVRPGRSREIIIEQDEESFDDERRPLSSRFASGRGEPKADRDEEPKKFLKGRFQRSSSSELDEEPVLDEPLAPRSRVRDRDLVAEQKPVRRRPPGSEPEAPPAPRWLIGLVIALAVILVVLLIVLTKSSSAVVLVPFDDLVATVLTNSTV